MARCHSVTVIVKCGGTVVQCHSVTVIVKCGGTAAECHSDRNMCDSRTLS